MSRSPSSRRIVVALGGNAITGEGDSASAQEHAVDGAMGQVAELVIAGWEVVLTHGNGPQVGNLLVKNRLARDAVPPVPLDWCVAQTQATLGYLMVSGLERALDARGKHRLVTMVLTRVLVDVDDPGFDAPNKPVGRYEAPADAAKAMAQGEVWHDFGSRGWRRVVASPQPKTVLDQAAIVALLGDGAIVIAGGGGGIPVVWRHRRQVGVEAVLDKDLTSALLAETLACEALIIASDVPGAAVGYGTPDEEWLGRVSVDRLARLAAEGHFEDGSMGPKVQAAIRFVRSGGTRATITSLDELVDAADGRVGTVVTAHA